jgi:hypothetical protein
MTAAMVVFVDELLQGETVGFRTVDHSKDVSDPGRVFWLKVVLLYWVGDYPGIGKIANMKHAGRKGCHWCEGWFYPHSPGHNVCIHNRRNLRPDHPYRHDDRWGEPEIRGPIPLRTKTRVEEQAREIAGMNEDATEQAKQQKQTGIDGFCMFMLLALFDVVEDMLPDMMHVTKGRRLNVHTMC